MEPQSGIVIPADRLDRETLRNLIEEFVTRDGTEMTAADEKIREVETLLRLGEVEIWFNEQTRTCGIFRVQD